MIYTDGEYIVADDLQELHKFCKSIGLKKSEHFNNPSKWRTDKSRAYYRTDYGKIIDKALSKGAKKVSIREIVHYANKLPATDIYESRIQEFLYKHFLNYNYKLCNTRVFDWESDFFCQSDSGYFVETEIKISRSDFFADFDKPKHKLFQALRDGKEISVQPWSWDQRGDLIVTYDQPKVITQYGPYSRVRGYGYGRNMDNWETETKNGKWGFWVNDWGFTNIRYDEKKIYAPCTRINYINLLKQNIPNQLYFAVPHKLVDINELPGYAGLLYIKQGKVQVIRRAPYLHKRKMDLDKILLSKFYALWTWKQGASIEEKVEMMQEFNKGNQQA